MTTGLHSWFVFALQGERYAIRTDVIKELILPPHVQPVPLAPPVVRGLVQIRGHVFPAIDLMALMGLGRIDAAGHPQIVVKLGGETRGFIVDELIDVMEMDERSINPVPDIIPESSRRLASGLYDDGEVSVLLVDDEAVLHRLQRLNATADRNPTPAVTSA